MITATITRPCADRISQRWAARKLTPEELDTVQQAGDLERQVDDMAEILGIDPETGMPVA